MAYKCDFFTQANLRREPIGICSPSRSCSSVSSMTLLNAAASMSPMSPQSTHTSLLVPPSFTSSSSSNSSNSNSSASTLQYRRQSHSSNVSVISAHSPPGNNMCLSPAANYSSNNKPILSPSSLSTDDQLFDFNSSVNLSSNTSGSKRGFEEMLYSSDEDDDEDNHHYDEHSKKMRVDQSQ